MTVFDAFDRYRRDVIVFGNMSAKTEESYVYACKSLLGFLNEDIPLESLTFIHVREWKVSLEKRKLSTGTIRGYIVCLRSVLKHMTYLKYECLDPNSIPIPKRSDPTPTFITPAEVSKLITTANRFKRCSPIQKARARAIVAVLYASGVRSAELLSLNREDINGDTFTVLGKGRKRRPCMLDERAIKLLNIYLTMREDNNPALFVDHLTKTRMTRNALNRLFARLSRECGLNKYIHVHTLRHSFANSLMRNGCHIYPLSRLMGHSSIATTQTYFTMYDPELAEVYKKYHTI